MKITRKTVLFVNVYKFVEWESIALSLSFRFENSISILALTLEALSPNSALHEVHHLVDAVLVIFRIRL